MGRHYTNYRSGKKHSVVATIAVAAAIIGGLVAVFAYLRKKAADINEKLDFDGDLYFEDDDYFETSDPNDKNRCCGNNCHCDAKSDYDDSELDQAEKLAEALASDEDFKND